MHKNKKRPIRPDAFEFICLIFYCAGAGAAVGCSAAGCAAGCCAAGAGAGFGAAGVAVLFILSLNSVSFATPVPMLDLTTKDREIHKTNNVITKPQVTFSINSDVFCTPIT
jgi:uncharacterized spore protein YtfJ